MFCKIGTIEECGVLFERVPMQVVEELKTCIGVLDNAYGKERNCYRVGGYIIYADTSYDVKKVKDTFLVGLCEWESVIEGYIFELHLLGDDFSVVFCYPEKLKKKEV